MKALLTLAALIFTLSSLKAQEDKNPFPKRITVTGSAEMEVTPDQIDVVVTLTEYEIKGKGKVDIATIKQQFLNMVRATGIPDSSVTISSYDGQNGNPWLRKKNKKDELLASISYQLRIKSSKQLDDVVDRLDEKATQNFYIASVSSSKMMEYRRQLKIQAMRAAKDKAKYLVDAIDEKLGEVITINEPTEYTFTGYNSNVMMRNQMSKQIGTDSDQAPVDFKKIKLKYDVSLVFAIK